MMRAKKILFYLLDALLSQIFCCSFRPSLPLSSSSLLSCLFELFCLSGSSCLQGCCELSLNLWMIHPNLCLVVDTACTPSFHFIHCGSLVWQLKLNVFGTRALAATIQKKQQSFQVHQMHRPRSHRINKFPHSQNSLVLTRWHLWKGRVLSAGPPWEFFGKSADDRIVQKWGVYHLGESHRWGYPKSLRC